VSLAKSKDSAKVEPLTCLELSRLLDLPIFELLALPWRIADLMKEFQAKADAKTKKIVGVFSGFQAMRRQTPHPVVGCFWLLRLLRFRSTLFPRTIPDFTALTSI